MRQGGKTTLSSSFLPSHFRWNLAKILISSREEFFRFRALPERLQRASNEIMKDP
jgi:hypothetical protein